MTPDLRIRDAKERDVDVVLALYEAAGLDQPGDNDRAAAVLSFHQVQAAGGRVLLAERDGLAIGTLTLFLLPLIAHRGRPAAVVEGVAVHPAAQGDGVGRALMTSALQRASTAGCYKLALSSNALRTGAHAFYERLGFRQHGFSFHVPLQPGGLN